MVNSFIAIVIYFIRMKKNISSERSLHDQTVIRLILYFFRNITAIPDLEAKHDLSEETLRMVHLQVIKKKKKGNA